MGNACTGDAQPNSQSANRLKKKKSSNAQNVTVSECKVVILGDTAVGKTSIALRYLENKFIDSHIVTLGAQFQQPKITLKNGNILKLNLWDTAGEEKFRSMLPMYYKSARGAILTYDIGNKQSFNSVHYWIEALNEHVKAENTVLLLVGNKSDLPPENRQVDSKVAAKLAEENNMIFIEVSAKNGDGVNELFTSLAEELVTRFGL